ncbi:hypothetical protein Pint_21819 [Pistacia integerrima]|uniref:Uncharacterized protein n=1 Tax=Pistacia integerrima TaxID=434235 RepID=A0ACC0XCR6_9ROSI|nr:hypothetical protein Pint_21819 [Pistacia integerrima]
MATKITIFLVIKKLEDQLTDSKIEDEQVRRSVSQYIEKLKESLKIFEGSEDDQGSLLKIDEWKIKFLQNVYLAEEAVDTFRLRKGLETKKDFRFSLEIRNLMNQLTSTVPEELRTTSSAGTEDVPETKEQLKKLILSRNSSLFLMWGIATVPRITSPLWKIYGSADVKKQFQCRAWIDVSEFNRETELLTKIVESVTEAEEEWGLPETSIELKLHNFLMWKRYLVVLYNLTLDIWENLLRLFVFPNSLNGSRVILTFSEAHDKKLESAIPNARSCGNLSAMQQESTVQSKVSDEEDIVGFRSEVTDLITLLPTGDKHSQDFTDGTEITGPEVSDKEEIVVFSSEVSDSRILVPTRDEKSQDFTDITENTVPEVSDEKEVRHLRTVLTGDKPLISVLGVPGSGKTTLVKNVYNHLEIKKEFPVRAWVSVSKLFKEKNVLVKILEQVTQIRDEEKWPLDKLKNKLDNLLKNQTYLIVLDDVHTSDIWRFMSEKLNVFPTASKGRVILIFHDLSVIVRDPKIAPSIVRSVYLLTQRPLTDEESWSLFLKKVSRDARRKVSSQEELLKKILRKCGGLTLSICVLAGLLSTRKYSAASLLRVIEDPEEKHKEEESTVVNDDIQQTKEEAAGTSEHTRQGAVSGDQNPPNILVLGYRDLHFCLRSCLLYMCLFPRSYEIPIRRLFLLWIAEGLMKPLGGVNTEPEDLAESCFEELERRNMIQVERRRSNGKPKTCCLPGPLHDLLYQYAERSMGYFHIQTKSDSTSKSPNFNMRMLVEYEDVQNNSFSEFQHLRSYISLNSGKRNKPSDAEGKFLEKITTRRFGFLTLLDLEGVYRPRLPETLGKKLPLLRYVGLRRTFLKSIPESVGDIPCLETLDVKHTLITTLPIAIWGAKNLRHLYMHRIYMEPVSVTKTDEFATKLQTLWGLLIDDNNHTMKWLTSLEGLRKLGLTCHENSVEKILPLIRQMTSLRSLRMKSVDEDNKPSDLHISFNFQHEMLTNLYLVGKCDLQNMEWLKHLKDLPNLRVLTLSASQLSEDPMQILQWLEHLKVLRLFANSYTGKEMTCGRRGFPELQVLKLWMLTELSKWTIEEGAMPALRELEIRCCKKLEKPIELEKVTTLEKLTLTSMKKNFVDDVEGKFGKEVEFIVNDRDFRPLFVSRTKPSLAQGVWSNATLWKTTYASFVSCN